MREAGTLCVCQSVLSGGGETGGRYESGGIEQLGWLSRSAAQRGEVTFSQMVPAWYPHFTAAYWGLGSQFKMLTKVETGETTYN